MCFFFVVVWFFLSGHDDFCRNDERIAVLENRLDNKHERLDELEEDIQAVDSRVGRLEDKHHKDFVSFRNSLNELHIELVALNTSLNTTTKIITVIGVLISILIALTEVFAMFLV